MVNSNPPAEFGVSIYYNSKRMDVASDHDQGLCRLWSLPRMLFYLRKVRIKTQCIL